MLPADADTLMLRLLPFRYAAATCHYAFSPCLRRALPPLFATDTAAITLRFRHYFDVFRCRCHTLLYASLMPPCRCPLATFFMPTTAAASHADIFIVFAMPPLCHIHAIRHCYHDAAAMLSALISAHAMLILFC